jgi:hypothetical protein
MMGSTASNLYFQSANSDHRDAGGKRVHPHDYGAPDDSGNAITIANSSIALPTRLHTNLISAPQPFL